MLYIFYGIMMRDACLDCNIVSGLLCTPKTNEKLTCCCYSRSYLYDEQYIAYWQTIKQVSVTSLWTADTHDPIQRIEFMNAPKSISTEQRYHWAYRAKFSSSRSQWITERNTTSARLIVCLRKLTFAFSLIRFFRCVLWLNDTSYSKSVWRDKKERAC